MRVLSLSDVAIGRVNLPGDLRARMNHDSVIAMAESMNAGGLINEPVVRKHDMRLIAGRDRFAAALRLGWTNMRVKLVECSDEEADLWELEENVVRRNLVGEERDKLVQKAIEARTKALTRVAQGAEERRRPGRPETAKGRARKEVAERLGIKPESVRQAEIRARKRQERKAAHEVTLLSPGLRPADNVDPTPPSAPELDDFGVLLDPEFSGLLVISQQEIDKARATVDRARQILAKGGELTGIQARRWRRAATALDEARELVKGLRPISLCPYCKGQQELVEGCAYCEGTAIRCRAQREDKLPEELLQRDPLMVMVNGKPEPILFEEDAPAEAPAEEWPE
jgi:ParB-like chromosome segregation protein Spo0J